MPEQDLYAPQADHAEEVLDVAHCLRQFSHMTLHRLSGCAGVCGFCRTLPESAEWMP
jgi:hypothetical protein